METEEYEKQIKTLPFSFTFKNTEEEERFIRKKPIWLETASKVFRKLQAGRILIEAHPGAGKTAMAIITSLGFRKTMFATIAWEHTIQHKELFAKITGSENGAFIMKNKIPAQKRVWNKDARITFATTGILINDLEKGRVDLRDYDLLVVDENDLASGEHVVARLARIAKEKKIMTLYLTATLGSKKTKEKILRNCGIYEIVKPNIPLKEVYEYVRNIDLNPALREINGLFVEMIREDFDYLKSFVKILKNRGGVLCSQAELEAIKGALELILGGTGIDGSQHSEYFGAMSRLAYYQKLHTAYRKCLVNSYEVFLDYAERLALEADHIRARVDLGKEPTKAAKRIVADERFHKIIKIVQEEKDTNGHPKFRELEDFITSPHIRHFRQLVFVDEVATAEYFKKHFETKYGLRTATYVGSQTTKEEKMLREQLRQKINAGEIDITFGTSAIERGVDARLDMVHHYTIAMERRSREQRSGRAGRFGAGYVYHYCLVHPLDQIFIWATGSSKPRPQKRKKRPPYFFESKPYQTTLFP